MNQYFSKVKSETIGLITICSYGVEINIEFDLDILSEDTLFGTLRRILPTGFVVSEKNVYEHRFGIFTNYLDGKLIFELYINTEIIARTKTLGEVLERFESRLRLTIAEFAVGKVFLHAGVVGWKGKALILPGKSFHGKTTMVAELVRHGADYFSDEYAVLDEEGFVHPFPKMLSVRGIIDDFQQMDLPVETFGGQASLEPLEAGLILLTEFDKNALWNPEILNPGAGVLEILSHTIPIRYKPEFTLKVLNKITNRAIITKTQRGEAKLFAEIILDFFEKQAF